MKKLHIDECQKLEVNKYNRGLLESCVVNVPSLTWLYTGGGFEAKLFMGRVCSILNSSLNIENKSM